MERHSLISAMCLSAAAAALASMAAAFGSQLARPSAPRVVRVVRRRRLPAASRLRLGLCVVNQGPGAPRGVALTLQASRGNS